jgi:cell wall-associated NlpC family hydrolase
VRVPYVKENGHPVPDEYGDPISKKYNKGRTGLDCSGLACYAYNLGAGQNLDVLNTNAQMLWNMYGRPNSHWNDRQTGDMIFIDYDEDDTVDHVGIIYKEPGNDEVIHATGSGYAQQIYTNRRSGRSVVHEDFLYRGYWYDENKFVGLGRLQVK